MKFLALAPLLLLAACSKAPADAATGATPAETAGASEKPAEAPVDQVTAMNNAIDALMAKPEHQDPEVTVQHLLVGVAGALPGATRSPGDAETRTAELYARILAGEDFDTLVKNNTEDSHPGIYPMGLKVAPAGGRLRSGMVAAFGDVGWRLAVGEIGICRYDGGIPGTEPKSPFGYHIVKRLK